NSYIYKKKQKINLPEKNPNGCGWDCGAEPGAALETVVAEEPTGIPNAIPPGILIGTEPGTLIEIPPGIPAGVEPTPLPGTAPAAVVGTAPDTVAPASGAPPEPEEGVTNSGIGAATPPGNCTVIPAPGGKPMFGGKAKFTGSCTLPP